MSWDEIRDAIDAKDTGRVMNLVRKLDAAGRKEVADRLPGRLKELRDASKWGELERGFHEPLILAGAGTIGGAAAAAAWLCRREFDTWWLRSQGRELRRDLDVVTADRPVQWRADVGRRVAERIRVSDFTEQVLPRWHMAAGLTLSAGAEPPAADGFVVMWASGGADTKALADDPFLDALVPRLFEADGVGAALAFDRSTAQRVKERRTWADALTELAAAGRVPRGTLIDGCVRRFLRGGTPHELRWFAQLHELLEPTDDEVAARVRDYARLLPAAPSTIADLALRAVRRADELERVDEPLFEEAAGAVLFRPETKLIRAGLTWLDRTARKRGRVDAALRAVTAAFTCDSLDLRERAVKIAVRHAGKASAETGEQVRGAASGLPGPLRDTIAAAFGEVEAEAPLPVGSPPFTPREMPAPIASPAEMAAEFDALSRTEQPDWLAVERFLAALVAFAHEDAGAARDALRPVVAPMSWLIDPHIGLGVYEGDWPVSAVRSLFVPKAPTRLAAALASFVKGWARKGETVFDPAMDRFLALRGREIAASVGKVPVLLAAPTTASGHIDPAVLVERLERFEAAGAEPGRAELAQAMLRVPREIDAAAAARAGNLVSPAGRAMAAWLAAGPPADPDVRCEVLEKPAATVGDRTLRLPSRILSVVAMPGDSDVAHLCAFPEEGWRDFGQPSYRSTYAWWPGVTPSHREIAAAHLVPYQVRLTDENMSQGATMLALAEAGGPAGAATGTLLALTLANRHERHRADAVDALLTLSARGILPAAETGVAAGRLAAFDRIKFGRVVKALTAAADAGALSDVWTLIAAALPEVLPAPGERAPAGLPDLLALGTRAAETTGARGTVPALEAVAGRGGSSRLVKEAARLHRTLTAAT
ncbi:hypothetical protein F8568_024460 [Actinomadura sp. LD22]|uniref:Secreted protein n=1 Tax=Actinomadura physcomitrii TaxID=2650748 RepID=A0A6I4MFY6_9ACTN|nr:DUF6493 family protein [Actinomadura physcomitrii]MWA03475.1 hypothetical protein [Actinomadura physcomitrii]